MYINEKIQERLLKGRNIREFAKDAGVAHMTVFNFFKGKRIPQVEQLTKMCKAAGLSLVEFFTMIESESDNLKNSPWKTTGKKLS